MSRQPLKIIAAAAFIIIGTACAAIVWLAVTPEGTRWLLTTLKAGGISVQQSEGRIADRLHLTGVRITMPAQIIEIDSLELRWKPLLLLSGNIAVQKLIISGVRIQDNSPPDNNAPDLTWPKLPDSSRLFDGVIAQLRVSGISYRRLQEQAVPVTYIDGCMTWRDGVLSLTGVTAASPEGQVQGSLSAGFTKPSLTADLSGSPTLPVAGLDRLTLQIRPGSSTPGEGLSGTVVICGTSGGRKLLELSGDVGLTRTAVNLRQLRLSSPGRKGVITADGSLAFTTRESLLTLQMQMAGLDLAPEVNMPTDLSGTLKFTGTREGYRGEITLANRGNGWQKATVSAAYTGTRSGMKLAPLTGRVLDGSLTGGLEIDWRSGFVLNGTIAGRNLNPAVIDPKWQGVANFTAAGRFSRTEEGTLTGTVSSTLLNSRLHGQALTGDLRAHYADNSLTISTLILQGKGFNLRAAGHLNERLSVAAQVSDLSLLIPGAAGSLQGDGWVRWRENRLGGEAIGSGSMLSYAGTEVAAANVSARLDRGAGYPGQVSISLRDIASSGYTLRAVTIGADGTMPRHTVNAIIRSAESDAQVTLSAGYVAGIWQGTMTALNGADSSGSWHMTTPAAFAVSSGKISLSPLTLTSGSAEHLELSADLALKPLNGTLRAQWSGLNLARINPYLQEMKISGSSRGEVRAGFLPGKRLSLSGKSDISGTVTVRGGSLTIDRGQVTVTGGDQGIRAAVDISEATGGRIKGTFSSHTPLLTALPEQGKMTAEWGGIDVALFKPWLPEDTGFEGHLNGRANGNLLTGRRFELDGTASLSAGALHREGADGGMNLNFTSAATSWRWRGEELAGTLALNMAPYGQARTHFQLPVPARFPVAVNPEGPLLGSLVGTLQEQGIISALLPGLVQKSSGELDIALDLSGTWAMPQVSGTLQFAGGNAYLPAAGIHLREARMAAHLEKNIIRVDSYRARSGTGHIEGSALITLAGWRIADYRGTVKGENFQTVHLPELRILCTPELTFEGTPQKLSLRGELRLPELQFDGTPVHKVIAPSSDVIREGIIVPTGKPSSLALDVRIKILLGERVQVNVAGIEAQLGGAMDLTLGSLDSITSAGEIKVVKGRYRTYGVNLEIVRGRLFFAGGPVTRPTLDFLALRTVGDVRAGVTVTGSLQKPVATLYSDPVMPDVDIMSYIVLGQPYESNGEQTGLATRAAGALLTSKQASAVQDQLKSQFGLSTLDIQGGVGTGTGPTGYKPLQVTAPGEIPAALQSGITDTVLTVGKFLTPKLYVSYGRSLFTGENLFLMRYDIFKKWQIETQTGSESGADLFYKLEFR